MKKKTLKILFINPVIRAEDRPRHVPYGIAQLVAIARDKKHKIQVLDANAFRPNDTGLREAISMDSWDVIATGGLITTYGYIKKCVKIARELCPESLIVAGGGFLSAIPREVMRFMPEINVGVIGEGVLTFPELLGRVSSGETDFSDVAGIILRDKKGDLKLTKERPLLEDVDAIPFPAFDMFPMEIYFKNSSLLLSEEAMAARRRIDVMASYGCPFKCKFCFHLGLSGEIKNKKSRITVDFKGKRNIRMHSPEYIIELIKHLKKQYSIDFISFIDENFVFLDRLTGGKWMSRFFDLWEKNGFVPSCIKLGMEHSPKKCNGIHWGATAHAALVKPELLINMHKMGCSYLDYGFESFDDNILRGIGKGATSEMNERALKWTIGAGIRPIPNQIIGFPDESFESIRKNIAAWKRLGIKCYPFFATPYPGSEWFQEYRNTIIEQYGGNLEDFLLDLGNATKLTAVISKNFNSVELLGLRELMVNVDSKRIDEYERSLS